MSAGLVAVVMIFSIPIIAIISDHLHKSAKLKAAIVKDQLELERLKQENYVLETKKMRHELEQMKLDFSKEEHRLYSKVD